MRAALAVANGKSYSHVCAALMHMAASISSRHAAEALETVGALGEADVLHVAKSGAATMGGMPLLPTRHCKRTCALPSVMGAAWPFWGRGGGSK